MLLSIDAGKDTTKGCKKNDNGDWETITFRSRIYDLDKRGDIDKGPNDYIIKSPIGKHLVGESGTVQKYTTSKTDIVNMLCEYVAITRFLEPNELTEIDLVTGCPASVYRNPKLREEYIANIKGDGNINIDVDGENFRFKFNSITVRPEGAGILTLMPNEFLNDDVLIIDIGGQNLNATVYNNMVLDPRKMFTKNSGGIEIEQNLINTFETLGIDNIDNNIIRTAITNRTLRNDVISLDKTTEIINDEINLYIETSIIDELNKSGINPALFKKIFIGGTSYLIKDHLKQYFETESVLFMDNLEDSQFANAKGFYEMLQLGRE